MGMYLVADQQEPEPVASLQGLADVRAFAEEQGMDETAHLLDAGWCDAPKKLVEEAVAHPGVGDVAHTLEGIAAVARLAKKVVTLTDGFTK